MPPGRCGTVGSLACPSVGGAVIAIGVVPVVRPGRCLILMSKPSGLIVGLLFDLQLIVQVIHELEALQQHAEGQASLLAWRTGARCKPADQNRTADALGGSCDRVSGRKWSGLYSRRRRPKRSGRGAA